MIGRVDACMTCGRCTDLGMLLALVAAVSRGDASPRLSAAHAILNWRSDFTGVTRAAALQYGCLLKVRPSSFMHDALEDSREVLHVEAVPESPSSAATDAQPHADEDAAVLLGRCTELHQLLLPGT